VLWIIGFASLGIGLITLVPARTSGFLTDGARLLQIWRGGETAEADTALTTIVAWSMAGIRPAAWDPEVVRRALAAPAGPFRVVAHHSAWRHAADRGLAEEAAGHRAALLRHLDEAPSAIRAGLALDVAIDLALEGDVETATHLASEYDRPGPLVDSHLPPLARAAIAVGEGAWETARAAADEAEKLLDRALDPAARILDEERISAVRAAAAGSRAQGRHEGTDRAER
jgi:hypothetical protein